MSEHANGSALEASVIICTLDRRADLQRALDTLAAQRTERAWETIVVDNGSSDDTRAHVESRVADFPVPLRYALEPERGLSRARNRGLALAEGAIVVYIDDDVSCSAGWLEAHLACFADESVVATGGKILPVLPNGSPRWLEEGLDGEIGGPTGRYDYGDELQEIRNDNRLADPCGGNMGIRTELARSVDGFRVDLGWGAKRIPCEETEFFKRLAAPGRRMLYVPGASVLHHLDATRVGVDYFKRWHLGYGQASVLMKPPRNPVMHALKIVEQLFQVARYTPGARVRGDQVRLRSLRKRYQAMGRLRELLSR